MLPTHRRTYLHFIMSNSIINKLNSALGLPTWYHSWLQQMPHENAQGQFWPDVFHCTTGSHGAFSFLLVNIPLEAWQSKTSDTFGLFAQLENKGQKKRFIFLTSYKLDWHGRLVLLSWDLASFQCIWKPSYKSIKTTLTEILSTYQRQIKSDFPAASAELGKFHLLTSSTAHW